MTPRRSTTTSEVTVVSLDGTGTTRVTALGDANARELVTAVPARQFRMHKGQPHWSGQYWCGTTRDLEVYESRLELARLHLADHDPEIADLLPQPFVLRTSIGGKIRRHVPDFLFVRQDGHATVTDVKPGHRLADPRIAATLDWTRRAVEDRGWDYEVWTGADDVLLSNTRFLAAYRDERRVLPQAVLAAADTARPGMALGEAIDAVEAAGHHRSLARPAVLRLLWTREIEADLYEPLSNRTLLLPGAAS